MSHTTTKLAIGYAEWHEREAAQLRAHNAHSPLMPELADMHAETAQTLRTLVADNDTLRAEVEKQKLLAAEAIVAVNNRDRERMAAEREAYNLRGEVQRLSQAVERTRWEAIEEAARLCEANEITFEIVGTGRRYSLQPRGVTNTDGET